MNRVISIGIMSAILSASATAQDAASSVEFGGLTWDVQAERAELVTFKGKLALALEKGGFERQRGKDRDLSFSFLSSLSSLLYSSYPSIIRRRNCF